MNIKTSNEKPKARTRRKPTGIEWEHRRQLKAFFDSLSPEEHDRELKKLSSEDLFFLVADTIRATHKQNGQPA